MPNRIGCCARIHARVDTLERREVRVLGVAALRMQHDRAFRPARLDAALHELDGGFWFLDAWATSKREG